MLTRDCFAHAAVVEVCSNYIFYRRRSVGFGGLLDAYIRSYIAGRYPSIVRVKVLGTDTATELMLQAPAKVNLPVHLSSDRTPSKRTNRSC